MQEKCGTCIKDGKLKMGKNSIIYCSLLYALYGCVCVDMGSTGMCYLFGFMSVCPSYTLIQSIICILKDTSMIIHEYMCLQSVPHLDIFIFYTLTRTKHVAVNLLL